MTPEKVYSSAWTRTTEGRTFSTTAEMSFSSFWRVDSSWPRAESVRTESRVNNIGDSLVVLGAARGDGFHPGQVEGSFRLERRGRLGPRGREQTGAHRGRRHRRGDELRRGGNGPRRQARGDVLPLGIVDDHADGHPDHDDGGVAEDGV